MAKLTKRQKAIVAAVEAHKVYTLEEAVAVLESLPAPKFKESLDIAVNLGVDPRKSDQVVRGATTLPAGTGPRGLMPNPKVGTVTPDVATAVKNAKAGQARYRVDKAGIIHAAIGQVGFEAAAVRQNVEALVADLKRLKPATSKGVYIQKITLSSTMGPGLIVDVANVSK